MHAGTDNRLFIRVEGEFAVRYSPQGSDREFCTTTKNISGGGIRVGLLRKVEPGTVLDIEIFKYNTDIRTRCRGRVVWVWDRTLDKESGHFFEAGIQFIDGQLLDIGRFINYLKGQDKGFDNLVNP